MVQTKKRNRETRASKKKGGKSRRGVEDRSRLTGKGGGGETRGKKTKSKKQVKGGELKRRGGVPGQGHQKKENTGKPKNSGG